MNNRNTIGFRKRDLQGAKPYPLLEWKQMIVGAAGH
jgi:hypothetical protein